MLFVHELEQRIYMGHIPTQEDLERLYDEDLQTLQTAAYNLRQCFSNNLLDFRGVIRYTLEHPFTIRDFEYKVKQLLKHGTNRIHVDLCRAKFTPLMLDEFCDVIRNMRKYDRIFTGISHVRWTTTEFQMLHDAGCVWYNEFLGAPEHLFHTMAHATATYEEKIKLLKAAHDAGLKTFTGGFLDFGETEKDHLQLLLKARELGTSGYIIRSPEWGRESPDWVPTMSFTTLCKMVTILRFAMPKSCIIVQHIPRLFTDNGRHLLESGANGIFTSVSPDTFSTPTEGESHVEQEVGFVIG